MDYSFSDEEYQQRLEQQTMIGQDFMEAAFADWFQDSDTFRSPFPETMRDELSELTFRHFMEWTFQRLEQEAPISAEELGEKFSEIIRTIGLSLAKGEQERLSIYYPDLPRIGDPVTFHEANGEERQGVVTQRYLVNADGHPQLRLVGHYQDSPEEWESSLTVEE
jgi:hypothetical protein